MVDDGGDIGSDGGDIPRGSGCVMSGCAPSIQCRVCGAREARQSGCVIRASGDRCARFFSGASGKDQ